MRTLRTQVGSELRWARIKGSPRSLELKSETGSFAILTRRRGSHFIGETAEGRLSFKRTGFFHPRVTIREGDSEREITTVALSMTGSAKIEVPGAPPLRWAQTSFWKQHYVLRDDRSRDLLHARAGCFGGMRPSIDPEARARNDLPLLALLSGYLLKLAQDDAAAASVAASAAVFTGS